MRMLLLFIIPLYLYVMWRACKAIYVAFNRQYVTWTYLGDGKETHVYRSVDPTRYWFKVFMDIAFVAVTALLMAFVLHEGFAK